MNWPVVLGGLLKTHHKYRTMNATALKEQASRSKRVVTDDVYRRAKRFRELHHLDTQNYGVKYITVYNITDIMEGNFKGEDLEDE